jgi:hypothetical protein
MSLRKTGPKGAIGPAVASHPSLAEQASAGLCAAPGAGPVRGAAAGGTLAVALRLRETAREQFR